MLNSVSTTSPASFDRFKSNTYLCAKWLRFDYIKFQKTVKLIKTITCTGPEQQWQIIHSLKPLYFESSVLSLTTTVALQIMGATATYLIILVQLQQPASNGNHT